MLHRNSALGVVGIDIDPTQLDKQTQIYFKKFLQTQPSPPFWLEKKQCYQVPVPELNVVVEFYLTHRLLYRACNFFGKHAGEYRYEIISNKKNLGSGAFGTVYEIEGTLALERDKIIFKKKQRVVKVQIVNDAHDEWRAKTEYLVSARATHLHIKPLTIFNNLSYLVMRKMPGITLDKIIGSDRARVKFKVFSLEQRLNYAIALLNALQVQVHDQGLVHRDIKPDNMMINEEDGIVSANIIDFNLSRYANQDDGRAMGAIAYRSPEAMNSNITSNKSDIYAMAIVIAELFGENIQSLYYDQIYMQDSQGKLVTQRRCSFKNLFTDVEGLHFIEKKFINDLLQLMTDENPDNRPDAKQLVIEFLFVLNEVNQRQALINELCKFIFFKNRLMMRPSSSYFSFFPASPRNNKKELEGQILAATKLVKLLRDQIDNRLTRQNLDYLKNGELGEILAKYKSLRLLELLLNHPRSAKTKFMI